MNLYAYANQNPLLWTDPRGLAALCMPGNCNIPHTGSGVIGEGSGGGAVSAGLGLAAGVALAQCVVRIFDKLGNNDPDDEDECYDRWKREDIACNAHWHLGDRAWRACKERASERRSLCIRNGNRIDPNEPPEWRPRRDWY